MSSLIIGDVADVHVRRVSEAVREMGVAPPTVVDATTFGSADFKLREGQLSIDGSALSFQKADRGWLRRHAPSSWSWGISGGSSDSVKSRSSLALVASLSRIGDMVWLTSIDNLIKAEDRIYQLEVARSLGIRTPITCVASSERHLGFANEVVVKPLTNGFYLTEDGPRAIYANAMTQRELDNYDWAVAPLLVQEKIRALKHYRVATVHRQVWIADLSAVGRPLDWRSQPEAHSEWEATKNPVLANAAVTLAGALNAGYSSQDWLEDSEGLVFLDFNPGGQWLFLPDDISSQVTKSIAMFLIGASP